MAEYTREQVMEKVRRGESLERADLTQLAFGGAVLEGANLRRADLEGANLEGCNLKKANLANASLRDAYLAKANLEGVNFQKADLEGAKLDGANLQNADLSRANLSGASLEGAKLSGARMSSAQLDAANMGGAVLMGVDLSGADLCEAYLGGAKLVKADLRNARLEKANFETADLTDADLSGATLKKAYCEGATFCRAILEGAVLEECAFGKADLSAADLRGTSVRGAGFDGAKMTGTRLVGGDFLPEQLAAIVADWVDFSTHANEVKVPGPEARDYVSRLRSAAFVPSTGPTSGDPDKRFFGKGDVLRNATLEFGADSLVEVESRFEQCNIALKDGARLVVGPNGVLEGCQVKGAGEIVVHGSFSEGANGPGIVGPKRLVVGKQGFVSGSVQQVTPPTQFAFEKGCALRLKIRK